MPTLLFPTPPGQALTLCSSIKRLMGFKPVGKYGPTGDMTMAIVLLQHTSGQIQLASVCMGHVLSATRHAIACQAEFYLMQMRIVL